MNKIKRLLTATFFVAASCGPAMAATIGYSHITPTTTAPITDIFTLSNFNTSLGTLTGVTITFTYTATGEVDVLNNTSANQNFSNATASVPVTLTAPAGLNASLNATAGPVSGVANGGPGTTTMSPGLTGTGTLTINVASVNFGLFEIPPSSSTGSYSVTSGSASFSGSSVSGVSFGGGASAGGTTTVTYTYTPPSTTPEPATMATMGGSLLGLGALLRRRRTMAKR